MNTNEVQALRPSQQAVDQCLAICANCYDLELVNRDGRPAVPEDSTEHNPCWDGRTYAEGECEKILEADIESQITYAHENGEDSTLDDGADAVFVVGSLLPGLWQDIEALYLLSLVS